jgi:aminopeptidase-like protein
MRGLPLARFTSVDQCRPLIDDAWQMMQELYPLCRSITGEGVRHTLEIVGRRIPLSVKEVPSGTPVFDWVIPQEWCIRDAWIKDPAGRRVVDFRAHNLHVMSYSRPVRTHMTLEELRPHLHTIPDHPDWIPYRTTYYKDDWGFCLTQRQLESLTGGEYEVCIDSSLTPGSLSYGECYLPGATEQEFLVFTHICHPSLCNDNLTGIALTSILAQLLQAEKTHFSYRFVFAPGTIGSIAWLAQNEEQASRVRHGLVLGLLGDRGSMTYKRSRRLTATVDRIAALVLARTDPLARLVDFSPYGYDERQLCSPGFNLPVGRLTRTPNSEYPEYHSSADDFSIISREALAESLFVCMSILRIADRDAIYLNTNPKCEPRLGARGLFRNVGGQDPGQMEHAFLWILNQSDGGRSLLEIAERSQLPFEMIATAADALLEAGLLQLVDSPTALRGDRS